MRQGQGSKRSRNRGGGNRRGGRQQSFDSNGPSVRIRGSAQQIHEKYLTLARDAASSGDRVAAENYFQHAEHYHRVLAAEAEQREKREQRNNQQGGRNQKGNGRGNGEANADDAEAEDAVVEMKSVDETSEKAEKPKKLGKSAKSKKSDDSAEVAVEAIAAEPPAEETDRAVGD